MINFEAYNLLNNTSQIYNMLMDYKGNVTIKIDGIAASAASVIAMAGTTVKVSPTSLMMIHNPLTVAIGDSAEMKKAIQMLDEVKESIINAYELKTGQPRAKLSKLMDGETWLNANKALELGFADEMLFEKNETQDDVMNYSFSRQAVTSSLLDKLIPQLPKAVGIPVDVFETRLNLIK